MGCASSNLDNLPAVTLCRDRRKFLDEAIKLRFALAEAHFAYIHSLIEIGGSLHSFIDQHVASDSRKLSLPPEKKLRRRKHSARFCSRSGWVPDRGSGICFGLEFEDGSDGSGSFHRHSVQSSPLHHLHLSDGDDGYSGGPKNTAQNPGAEPFVRMNYMKSKAPPPAVVYLPNTEEVIYVGESSSSSPHYRYPYPNFGNPNHDYGSQGGAVSQFYGSSQPSPSKPQPPPPSPPRASAWDFLDPFGSYDHYHAPPYTPLCRDSENLPNSEEGADPSPGMVKEVHKDLKFVESSLLKVATDEAGGNFGKAGGGGRDTEASAAVEDERKEYEVHVVEKKLMDGDKSEAASLRIGRKALEAGREIEAEFVRAAESGNEVAKMLEIGKLPYKRKHVPSKTLDGVSPSKILESEEEVAMKSGSLSSTLQRLYLWEKKLDHEVKGEEKLRMVHDRKVCQLKRLEGLDADTQKLESIRIFIGNLSVKISMAIQVVDKISVIISKIRDEELWPQLNELIQGLTRMWKRMLECHRVQLRLIRETRGLGPIVSGKKLDDAHLEATQWLEHELVRWTLRFSNWIDTQKSYANALNNWLLKCLLYEPEETPDGIAPFSPSRIGAPPIFVICNQWSQTVERLSEKEVIHSMRKLTTGVHRAWEQDKEELRKRASGNKDMERKVKMLDGEDEKIRKKLRALEKKMGVSDDDTSLVADGNLVCHGDSSGSSLKSSLEGIFEALERFAADSMKAYEELLRRTKDAEERLSRERE